MATIGQVLTSPEVGWKRIEETDVNFVYTGTWGSQSHSAYSGGSRKTQSNTILGNKIKFKFYGSKIRVVTSVYSTYSNNIKITIDGVSETFSLANPANTNQTLVYEKTGLTMRVHEVEVEKMSNGTFSTDFIWDAIDIDDTGMMMDINTPLHINKILILSDSTNYKTFDFETSSWEDFLISEESPSEQDFLTNGMNKKDIELIPESAWRELDGHSINILEYTDNPNQTESIVETETEPFTIYDEFGDAMEVLYYTDDLAKTEAELEITANYSPLDEFDEDFEVVTWTDEAGAERFLNMNALPQPQFVTLIDPHNIYGDFGGILPEELQKGNKIGILRYLISPNGTDWRTWNGASFVNVDVSTMENISNQGLSLETINNITQIQWNTWQHDKLYVGVFIDEDIRGEAEAIVQSISYKSLVGKHTTKISDAKMYILNTKSTINVEFKGSTVVGSIDDEDKGKVQYRILLNDDSFYPADGSFTPLLPSPLNISVTIPSDQIRIDENNTLRIEFQDYWGTTDYWERNFIGTYSGLLFLDESGDYYSTNIGDILKYLDFGVIIAGQTTLEHKIRMRNTYGFPVKNVHIHANQENFPSGLSAQFGTNDTSFEALDSLPIEEVLADGDELDFYIRLSSKLGVQPVTNGRFDIIVTADQDDGEEEVT